MLGKNVNLFIFYIIVCLLLGNVFWLIVMLIYVYMHIYTNVFHLFTYLLHNVILCFGGRKFYFNNRLHFISIHFKVHDIIEGKIIRQNMSVYNFPL